jgi:hypothetical protein
VAWAATDLYDFARKLAAGLVDATHAAFQDISALQCGESPGLLADRLPRFGQNEIAEEENG